MKRMLLPALLAIPMVWLTLSSCNKEDKTLNGDNATVLRGLFNNLRTAPQAFTVTAGTSQTITGAKGTLISFNPQSFKDAAGNIISNGTISIQLTELYKPGDMIANRVTTTTAANVLLTSGGSVNIKATMNGQEVRANYYSLGFKQPAASANPMALFMGYETTDATGTSVKWGDDTTGTVLRTEKIDSMQQFYYLFDSCTAFNWVNCDHFYTAAGPKTDIQIVMPDNTYDASNTQIFLVFPAINSVTAFYGYNAATHTFSLGYPGYYLPIGTTVSIMVIGAKNGSYFSALQQSLTVTNGMSLNITPTTQSLSTIQAQLSGL